MYVHKDSNDFAFHHIPKTGGTSVMKMLLGTGLSFGEAVKNVHAPLSEKKEYIGKYKTIYTNVRDPYERIVSLYTFNFFRCKFGVPEASFSDFFYNYWYPNPEKSEWLLSTEEHLLVDGSIPEKVRIIKLEDMGHAWPVIIETHFGKKVLEVPRENYTLHGEPAEYFDKEMIEKVKQKEGWVLDFLESKPTYSKGVCR